MLLCPIAWRPLEWHSDGSRDTSFPLLLCLQLFWPKPRTDSVTLYCIIVSCYVMLCCTVLHCTALHCNKVNCIISCSTSTIDTGQDHWYKCPDFRGITNVSKHHIVIVILYCTLAWQLTDTKYARWLNDTEATCVTTGVLWIHIFHQYLLLIKNYFNFGVQYISLYLVMLSWNHTLCKFFHFFFHRGMVILWPYWPFDHFLHNYLILQYYFCVSWLYVDNHGKIKPESEPAWV